MEAGGHEREAGEVAEQLGGVRAAQPRHPCRGRAIDEPATIEEREQEARFAMLARANPEVADQLMEAAQHDIDNRWHLYEQMVNVERTATFGDLEEEDGQ